MFSRGCVSESTPGQSVRRWRDGTFLADTETPDPLQAHLVPSHLLQYLATHSRLRGIDHPFHPVDAPATMKTLLILRHGRALPAPPGGDDHDRALHRSGASDVVRVAEGLRTRGLRPDHILTSSARRAVETTSAVQTVLEVAAEAVERDRRIYLADAWELLAIMHEVDDAVATLLVVGHNPTLSHIGSLLTGRDVHLDTSGLLALTHPALSWSRLALDGRGIPL